MYLCIVIAVIFLLLIYNYSYEISLYFSSPDNYKNYRLADMVRCDEIIRSNPMGKKYHLKYYPDSIASEYLRRTNKTNDIKLLYEIVCNFNKNIITDKDLLIVHLRVGEVLNDSKYSVTEFLEKEKNYERYTPQNFVKPLDYYNNIIKKYRKILPKKVKFFAGGCFCDNKEKSYKYIKAIEDLFEKEGFEIIENNYFNNPDEDFVYMSRSKHFILSGGGFSELISEMVLKGDGKVYK